MLARVIENELNEDDLSGAYATPPEEIEIAETHPRLIQEVVSRPERQFTLYYSAVFEIPSAAPCGGIEIAADAARGIACGFFLEPGQPTREPLWVEYDGDIQNALFRIYEVLKAEGALP